MRKQLLAVWLPLLILALSIGAEAQSTSTGADTRATVQKVDVMHGDDGISVEITARGQVTPKLSALGSPARVLVTLPNTVTATVQNHISVGSDGVKGVRIGTDGNMPPTTSVVIDLVQACQYELIAVGDNRIVVKLHSAAVKTSAKAEPAPTKPRTASTVAPASTGTAVAMTNPTPTANTRAALSAAFPAAIPSDDKTSKTASATDFAFVEPSYQKKTDDKATTDETAPLDRAAGAAAKFVDKPEGDLLPTPSAAMQPQADQAGSVQPIQPAVNLAAEGKGESHLVTPISAPKYTGEPISVNLKDVDLKDFFRLIHEISGLNVVLDPNVKGALTIVLDDVPWDQALDIVLKNNDLARQLDGNVLRIATLDTLRHEAESRRAEQEAEALAVDKQTVTRFLSYAHAKDVLLTVKKFLSQRGDAVADERTNAVIISDIPAVMPNVDRLLTQLDRKTQEVEIEARVVAATRSFAREIGTQLGFGWGNAATSVGGASAAGTSPLSTFGIVPKYPIIGTTQPTGTTGVQIPLFSNLGATGPTSGFSFINASSSIRLDAILTMDESRGLLKILSRPRVVTQNNIQALVRQGVRVPIVTQAQLGGPPTVTYVDAFLRLTVIPQITSEGTIFLNVDVENTTPDFGETVNGNPTLITQQATTQVLVTDGGTVVIGGVIQTNNSINVAQVPLLGSIPWLGNLFKHTSVSTTNQELIFFITPRVIQT
jgi:type IV pilus secretin PilQ/predicted competence protein